MRTNDVRDELAEGIEPAPMPAIGQDGGMTALEPVRSADELPPRLCEQGPCSHYHCFSIVMDAAKPRGERVDDQGHVVGPAPDVRGHLEYHHYCYPDVGIETILGDLPVVECNRWNPLTGGYMATADDRRRAFLASPEGQQYLTALDRWTARQNELRAQEDEQIAAAQAEIEAAEAARAADTQVVVTVETVTETKEPTT